MKEYEGKFQRYKKGLPYAAFVKMIVEESENNSISINCIGDGWIGQGYFEFVGKSGYENWKEGAVIGIKYALGKQQKTYKVVVTEISGMITDTSPSAVAAATIYGFWNAVDFVPSDEEIKNIEKVVFENGYHNLPNFDQK